MKILVIEDQPVQLKLAHQVLSSAGHNVSDAERAETAFASVVTNRPDLILLDLSLPLVSGFEIVSRLKADPETRDIPVVAVTSYPERYTPQNASAAGCDYYIQKPFNTRQLSDQLTSVAEKMAEKAV
jgi:CheY-like chemotaxis protein